MAACEMVSLEEARELVLSRVRSLPIEEAGLLDAVGRVAARDLASDIDVSPFAHAAMDGFALRSAQLEFACEESPVELDVIAEIAAGEVFEGMCAEGECVRIMTGAPVPDWADTVVKYEIVENVSGDGRPGSRVAFSAPSKVGANIRAAGEEARAGEVVVGAGEVIGCAGVGFLASCGVTSVPVYARPRVAIIATGSELVDASEVPAPGKIRNSNSFALAACARAAGAEAVMLPIVEDTFEALSSAVDEATRAYDFVVTSGGAANGDFDFIKPVVAGLGELLMETVNMRPGKAQTFGIVNGTPVFGLPGNPAAAFIGFELIIRPALRKMQGYSRLDRRRVLAKLTKDVKKKDPRRIFLRADLSRKGDDLLVTPAKNQSSGSFGVLQRSSCLAVMPDGLESKVSGDVIECIVLDIPEEAVL